MGDHDCMLKKVQIPCSLNLNHEDSSIKIQGHVPDL